jgi:hypothetical protein
VHANILVNKVVFLLTQDGERTEAGVAHSVGGEVLVGGGTERRGEGGSSAREICEA